MARYKPYDYSQMKLIPVSFAEQILPGSFEHTLSELIDNDLDLTVFEARYRNDETGAPAYDPAILLKVILYAYSRGVTSSREIARLCRENVVFMALSADSCPHFSTLAGFVATLEREIGALFRDVLLICEEAGLIGREMFAVDGVKLPSNASKTWSGTREDLGKKAAKIERAMAYLLKRHRAADAKGEEPDLRAARAKQIRTLKAATAKIKAFVAAHPDKLGAGGRVKQSNITDNESAKMKTGKGVIQGYDALAVVDAKHQVVVHGAAYGEGQEHGLFVPALEGVRERLREIGREDVLKRVAVVADAGFHSEQNVRYAFEQGIDAYVADTLFRKRDPRFATAARHVPTRPDAPWSRSMGLGLFGPEDFAVAKDYAYAICPAGKRLYRNGRHCRIGNFEAVKFTGAKRDCGACAFRAKCLRHPERTPVRQVAIFLGRKPGAPETFTARMKRKIDSEHGRFKYSRRLGIVEPVFAHICSARGLRRLGHRGRTKVNTQWLLYCIVHNLGKVHRYGAARKRRRRQRPNQQSGAARR